MKAFQCLSERNKTETCLCQVHMKKYPVCSFSWGLAQLPAHRNDAGQSDEGWEVGLSASWLSVQYPKTSWLLWATDVVLFSIILSSQMPLFSPLLEISD